MIRAKQSCMRHHASVRLLARLRMRHKCVPCADRFTCLCVHGRAYSCLCVRVCPSVCNKCRSMCTLPLRPRPEVPGEGSSVEATALACLSAHHPPQLHRCPHTRTETLLRDLRRASHGSAAAFDWQRLERMDGGALELTRMKHAPFYRHDAQATRFKRTRTGAGGPRPPCRPRTKGGRLGSRRSTPAPGRRAHSSCAVGSVARSTLAVNNAFAGRSPFTAFIRECELSMGVQRMIAPFEQTVLLEVLRREPAPMVLDPFDTYT